MKKLIVVFSFLFITITAFSQPYFQKITTGIIATDTASNTMSAWGDYDANGYQDIVVIPWNDGCWNCRSPISFYKNNGNGNFVKGISILSDSRLSCNGVAWGDYDNDGRLDLIVTRYLNQTNLLFHNDGNGDFSMVTSGSIVTDIGNGTGCAWCDYDKDGWLDLFVSNGNNLNNSLYHNNGNGTFTKITTGAIVTDGGDSRSCAWGDYDNDGWPDLFVANYGYQHSFLYHNNGNGTFTRVLNVAPVDSLLYGSGCCWFDYDNDGWLDLLLTVNAGFDKLYHNNHDGTFTQTNLGPSQEWGWSYYPAYADIDNDGWTDLFIPKRNQNGYTSNNALFKNLNGADLVKLSSDIVCQEGGASDGGSFGDYNNDGKMDLLVSNGSIGYTHDYFYQNVDPSAGNYITVAVFGCVLNRSAIGSKVQVVTGNLKQTHYVSGGNGSQSMLWQHFGVGSATTIDSIIVTFTTGTVKVLTNVAANHIINVTDLNCVITGVNTNNNGEPVKFSLEQNYPNPFNPSTNIIYTLIKTTNVRLSVYDVTGKLVNYLVNQRQTAGKYEIQFDGSKLSSGIYIYKIETDEISDTKKMVMIK